MITYLDSEVGGILQYQDRLSGNVIDLGGGMQAISRATTVVDLNNVGVKAKFVRGDLCDRDMYSQFLDKEFDWAWCNHTLEDLYNPFIVLDQIQRIAKRAIIGVPNWTREAVVQAVREDWEKISGWPHHFWLIGRSRDNGALEFFPKQSWFVGGEYICVTPNINFEWDGREWIPYRNIYHEYQGRSLRGDLLSWLERRWMP